MIFLIAVIFSAQFFGQGITSYYDTKYGYQKTDSNTIVIFSENETEIFIDKNDILKKVITEKEYLIYLKFKDKDVLNLSDEEMIQMWRDRKPQKVSETETKDYFWFTFPQKVKIQTYTKYAKTNNETIETFIVESEKISTDLLTDIFLCLIFAISFVLILKSLVLYRSTWNTIKMFGSTLLSLLLILVISKLSLLKFFRYLFDLNRDPEEILSFIFVIYILSIFLTVSFYIFYERKNIKERDQIINKKMSGCIPWIFIVIIMFSIILSLITLTLIPIIYGLILLIIFGAINKILKEKAKKIGI